MQKGPLPARFRGGEAVGGVVQFICRLKAAFLGRRLQAAVAAGAAVAAVPGGGRGERQKAECRRRKPKVGARQPKLINPERGMGSAGPGHRVLRRGFWNMLWLSGLSNLSRFLAVFGGIDLLTHQAVERVHSPTASRLGDGQSLTIPTDLDR
jgi:hypothetical protein